MNTADQITLQRLLEELLSSVSRKEQQRNFKLKGKTLKIIKLIRYLRAVTNTQMEINNEK